MMAGIMDTIGNITPLVNSLMLLGIIVYLAFADSRKGRAVALKDLADARAVALKDLAKSVYEQHKG